MTSNYSSQSSRIPLRINFTAFPLFHVIEIEEDWCFKLEAPNLFQPWSWALPKNTQPTMYADGDYLNQFWQKPELRKSRQNKNKRKKKIKNKVNLRKHNFCWLNLRQCDGATTFILDAHYPKSSKVATPYPQLNYFHFHYEACSYPKCKYKLQEKY